VICGCGNISSLTQNRLTSQSEMAVLVASKRLENRIRPSTIARKTSDLTFTAVINADSSYNLAEVSIGAVHILHM